MLRHGEVVEGSVGNRSFDFIADVCKLSKIRQMYCAYGVSPAKARWSADFPDGRQGLSPSRRDTGAGPKAMR